LQKFRDDMTPSERWGRMTLPCVSLVRLYEIQGKKAGRSRWLKELASHGGPP